MPRFSIITDDFNPAFFHRFVPENSWFGIIEQLGRKKLKQCSRVTDKIVVRPSFLLIGDMTRFLKKHSKSVSSAQSIQDKAVILRLHRLGHLPPATSATQLMVEKGLPVLVLEFGNTVEHLQYIEAPIPKKRISAKVARFFPKRIRPLICFFSAYLYLSKQIYKGQRPTLFICHGLQEQLLAYLLFLKFKIPYIVHVHEIFNPEDLSFTNRLLLKLERRCLRSANRLIFPDQSRAEIYQRRYKLNCPIDIVYNCPRRRRATRSVNLCKRHQLNENSSLILYMGGLDKSNALLELIEAIAELPQTVLFLAGWGEAKYKQVLLETILWLGLEKRVIFLGPLDEKKWEYLENVDMSYCVYRPDTLRRKYQATASNKLMEAMAAGIPIIANSETDFQQIVQGLKIGICVKSINAKCIREAVGTLLASPHQLNEMSVRARMAHQSKYNFESQFALTLEAIATFFPRASTEQLEAMEPQLVAST